VPYVNETQIGEGEGFAHRVAVILAAFLLAYAAFELIQFAVYVALEGTAWLGSYGRRRFEGALQMTRIAACVLLLVGAAGMLKWKPWSRVAVMIWAVSIVILTFASNVGWFFEYAAQLRANAATTQIVNPPLWKMAVHQLLWWVQSIFLPALIWLIVRRPEIAQLYKPVRRGGFEVVPIARVAAAADGGDAARG
jgi:hypothetical protein